MYTSLKKIFMGTKPEMYLQVSLLSAKIYFVCNDNVVIFL